MTRTVSATNPDLEERETVCIIAFPDGRSELYRDEATRARQRSVMLAVHERAARAFAAYGNHENARQARAVADRLRAKIEGSTP